MLEIDVLLTEEELTKDFLLSLKKRYLSEKFFYWLPLSVKAWLDLCRGSAPYRNFTRSFQLVSAHAADIARQCTSRRLEVMGLGAGQGDKDLLALNAFRTNGRALRYRPVDSSQALLEMAVGRARRAGIPTRGLKADLENAKTFDLLARSAQGPRFYLVLGNSLGIIDPFKFLKQLGRLLRPQDLLLVDGEIYRPRMTLEGYDNPTNRRFAFAPLASLGLEEGRDGTLVFSSATDGRRKDLHLVSKHFRAARRLRIPVAGEWVSLRSGEKILMNSSWKYSADAFRRLLRETAGLRFLREYSSEDEDFRMVLAGHGQRMPIRMRRSSE